MSKPSEFKATHYFQGDIHHYEGECEKFVHAVKRGKNIYLWTRDEIEDDDCISPQLMKVDDHVYNCGKKIVAWDLVPLKKAKVISETKALQELVKLFQEQGIGRDDLAELYSQFVECEKPVIVEDNFFGEKDYSPAHYCGMII